MHHCLGPIQKAGQRWVMTHETYHMTLILSRDFCLLKMPTVTPKALFDIFRQKIDNVNFCTLAVAVGW